MATKVVQARVPDDLYDWVTARGMKQVVVRALLFYRDTIMTGVSDVELPVEYEDGLKEEGSAPPPQKMVPVRVPPVGPPELAGLEEGQQSQQTGMWGAHEINIAEAVVKVLGRKCRTHGAVLGKMCFNEACIREAQK